MTTVTAEQLQKTVAEWGKGDWTYKIAALRILLPITLSKGAMTFLCTKLKETVDKARFGQAFNWGLLTLVLDENAIRNRSFQDCFRPSRLPGHVLPGHVQFVWRLSAKLDEFASSTVTADRLRSWASYCELYRRTRSDELYMLRQLKKHSQYSLQAAIILADEAFSGFVLGDETYAARELQKSPLKETFDSLPKEEIASGASYEIESYNRVYGVSLHNFRSFTDRSPKPSDFASLLLLASRLRELIDLEASVFRLGYSCERTGTNKFLISPPNEMFGMALTFGYMRHSWSPYRFSTNLEQEALSLRDLFAEWLKRFGPDMVQFVQTGRLTRLRVEIPGAAARAFGESILLVDKLFKEEVAELNIIGYELLADYETLEKWKIASSLTIGDVIRISRIFKFFAYIRAQKLSTLGHDDIRKWNSVLVGLDLVDLVALMEAFGVAKPQAEDYLSLFIWDCSSRDAFLDLQYTPFLRIQTNIAIPSSIHACSNLVRNALLVSEQRLYSSGQIDPLTDRLAAALSTATNDVKKGVAYNFDGVVGDFDCIAKIADRVYLFECKNTLHPCSSFEQRTMFDHLEKAVEQLNRVVSLWKRIEFRKYAETLLGWELLSLDKLRTCIVLSTRLLSGAVFGGHPVRQVHELGCFITTGEGEIMREGVRKGFRLWKGETFSADELDAYLSDMDKVFGPIWKSFVTHEFAWHFDKVVLSQKAYGLKQETLLEAFDMLIDTK